MFDFPEENIEQTRLWKEDKNLRDIFVHVHEWHLLLIDWIESNQKCNNNSFSPEPLDWESRGKMIENTWSKHRETTITSSIDLLKQSHKNTLKLIEKFSDRELYEKHYFAWTGNKPLASYCETATAKLYNWAINRINNRRNEITIEKVRNQVLSIY